MASLLLAAVLVPAAAMPARPAEPPRGPVTVTADRADLERGGAMLYRGNVRLVSDGLVLTGDRLELRQPAPGTYEVEVTGQPARLQHRGTAEAPPVAASAARITYTTASAQVELHQGVRLDRGADLLTGEHMQYDAQARRIRASGGDAGQVRIVIQQPEQPAGNGKEPAP